MWGNSGACTTSLHNAILVCCCAFTKTDLKLWLLSDSTIRNETHSVVLGWCTVLHAGASTQMSWFREFESEGRVTHAGNRGPTAMNGCAVMYAEGKILSVGGAPSFSLVRSTRTRHLSSKMQTDVHVAHDYRVQE